MTAEFDETKHRGLLAECPATTKVEHGLVRYAGLLVDLIVELRHELAAAEAERDAALHAVAATARDRAFDFASIICMRSVLHDIVPLLEGQADSPTWARIHREVRRILDAPITRETAA